MSMITMTSKSAPAPNSTAANLGSFADQEVVEISLLLPAQWAQDLMVLSKQRRQSVGQILRSMIGHALHDGVESI
jgi:hypothetical protein